MGRFKYAMYVSSELHPHQAKTEEYNLNWAVLESSPIYHVLHKDHKALADAIAPVLRDHALPASNPKKKHCKMDSQILPDSSGWMRCVGLLTECRQTRVLFQRPRQRA